MLEPRSGVRACLGSACALILSACAVGPDFKAPAAPSTEGYTPATLPPDTEATAVPGGEAQHFDFGRDLPGQWWQLFASDELNALITEAIANYPDITAQRAALRAAQENVRAEQGVFLPQVSATALGARELQSGATIAPGFPGFITNFFEAVVNANYTVDLFGGERRTLEALKAQAAAQDYQLEASYLALTAGVAEAAVGLASTREQIAVTREIIALEEKQLAVIRRQLELGSRTRADVLQQQSNLAAVRATLPPLQQQLALAEHQLAVLTGHFPRDARPIKMELADLKLPQDLPISLPSSLVEQRPDIKIQEMRLHAASAQIGVATANMLPQLTLSASYGFESLQSRSLFETGSKIWSGGAGLTQPLFAGGSLRAKRSAAIDTFAQADAQYRLSVLQAFQNVADTLTALDNDAQALKADYETVNAAQASLDLTQRQYNDGAVDYTALLTAQQAYQQARIAYVRALAGRFSDTATLFEALGGGWWNRNDPGTMKELLPAANQAADPRGTLPRAPARDN